MNDEELGHVTSYTGSIRAAVVAALTHFLTNGGSICFKY